MKKHAIRTAAILLLLAMSLPCAPALASAANPAILELNHSGNFPARIAIAGQAATIEGVPDSADYRYLWLQLQTADGTKIYEEIAPRDSGGNAVFNVSAPSGRYYLELFHAAERYATYSSAIWGYDVQVDWRGGGGDFVESPMYMRNAVVSNGKREDLAALAYYLEASDGIQSDDAAILKLAAQTTSGLPNSYDKALAIHDWVCGNIYYDYDAYYDRTPIGDSSALGTLASRKSVCEGYANLTAALLRAAGIPAKKVSGYALGISTDGRWPAGLDPDSATNHSWNEAYIGGRWAIIDTTWDSGNEWEHGKISETGGLREYHYFDVSPALFAADHALQSYSESAVNTYADQMARDATPFSGNVAVNRVFGLSADLYTIDGANYMKLRDAAAMLSGVNAGVSIDWDGAAGTIAIREGRPYRFVGGELSGADMKNPAAATLPAIQVSLNGEKLFLKAYTIDGSTYFKLRDLGALLGFGVAYDGQTQTIHIDLSGKIG
jgi:hypothetical protein